MLGEITIAAHTASRKIVEMLMQPMISIAIANTTFVSQNLGAKKYARIRKGQKKCILLCFIWVMISIVISFTWIDVLLSFMVDAKETMVMSLAQQYSRISSLFYFVLSILFIYRNGLQGLGNGTIPIMSSCIEMGVKVLATFLLIPFTGYYGVCFVEPIAWSLMGPFLCYFFYHDLKKKEKQMV